MSFVTKADTILSKMYKDYQKLMKYLGIGIVATLIDWMIFYALIGYFNVFYMMALAISYLTSTMLSFFLNKRYTFQNTYKKVHYQLASFFVVAVLGLCLNEALVYGMAQYIFNSDSDVLLMISRIFATLVVFIWNFALNKRITFRVFQ
jgi:putative flippase GtrA